MQEETRLQDNAFQKVDPPNASAAGSMTGAAYSPNRRFFEQYWPFFLTAILIVAAVFRFTGVDWDQNQHLHPDERFLTMVSTAIRLPDSIGQYFDTAESPLNPYNNNFGQFVYGTAPIFIVRAIAEVLGQTGYGEIYLVGRIVSALFDLITCAMVFAIGRRLFDVRVGLFGAFLYGIAVLPIQQSHFFTVDAFGNVPIMLAFWFTLDIMEGRHGWLAYALAGASLGLAVASRINFLMFTAIILMAVLLRLVMLLGSVKRIGLAGQDSAARTFAMDAGVVVGDSAGQEMNAASAPVNTRTIHVGPIIIEIETKPRRSGSQGDTTVVDAANLWTSALYILTGLAICTFAALVIFRIAQPYAFVGLFGFNPKWIDDIRYISDAISGKIDAPPSHQWTDRAAYLFPLYNIFNYGLGIPFAIAAWAGFFVGIYEILRRRTWNHLLIVLWIGGFFLYQGQQFVLVVRYYLPLYPFFAIYAAFFVFWVWDQIQPLAVPWKTVARVTFAVLAVVLVGYTLFWAAAFTLIYTRPVSRIAASIWMVHNIPKGSVIANEHWDDGLPMRVEGLDPFGGMYRGLTSSSDGSIQNYGEDDESKRENVKNWLNEADYLVLSSNRLYGSIPRLPLRYPLTTKYYEWLFDGQLGFELIQEFTSYPQLFGIVINDDNSDEAFTVYDHPKVLIFKKSASYSPEKVAALFDSVDLSEVERLKPIDYTASKNGFKMSPELQAANYAGGTWSQIFDPNDMVNAVPVFAWLVMLWVIGIIAFPYTFVAFRRFADRGYAFAKAVGILAFAWLSWTLASYRALPFERTTMWWVLGALVAGALFVVWRKRDEMGQYLRSHWKLLLGVEVVFLAFFAVDLAIRFANPDLWHPWFGGEKPMDFAYLNAVIKSTYFPAYNPWFEGGFINYYYFGQVISATLVKFTGIVPEVAYNLLLPMFFGLTASGAFGVAYNLVAGAHDGRTTNDEQVLVVDGEQQSADAVLTVVSPVTVQKHNWDWVRPVLAGIAAAFLVLLIGNLGQVGVLVKGLTDLGQQSGSSDDLSSFLAGLAAWISGKEIPVPIGNWYWTATRIIPDTINEIPFFTFVYADLHAHLMSLPFTLVGLGLAAHAVFNRASLKWYDLGIAAMVLGALRAINTWDYPTYLALIGCAMVLGYFVDHIVLHNKVVHPRAVLSQKGEADVVMDGALNWSEWIQRYLLFIVLAFVQVLIAVIPINAAGFKITFDMAIYVIVLAFALTLGFIKFGFRLDPRRIGWELGWRMIALIALSVLFYWPYVANYGTAYTSIEIWQDKRTLLSDYLVVHGIFLFLIAAYLFILVANKSARTMKAVGSETARSWVEGWTLYFLPALVVLEVGLLFLGLYVFAVIVPLVAGGAWVLLARDTAPVHRFIALILVAALLLTLMVEVVTLKGDIGRMNTVFKFYLQAWVFFGVASAAGLAVVFDYLWFRDPGVDAATGHKVGGDSGTLQTIKAAWWVFAAILILAGMLYPAFAGWAKMNDRFVKGMPPGLNGLDYMTQATYQENNSTLNLVEDYDAIQWLRQNIIGSPVIVEGNTGLYRWGNRVSINTGLPVVAGWDWHTKQQYSLLPGDIIDRRIADIRTIYETGDSDQALKLLRKYNVSIVYLGPLERAAYNATGLPKFDDMVKSGVLSKIYDQNGVQIYALTERVAQLVK